MQYLTCSPGTEEAAEAFHLDLAAEGEASVVTVREDVPPGRLYVTKVPIDGAVLAWPEPPRLPYGYEPWQRN